MSLPAITGGTPARSSFLPFSLPTIEEAEIAEVVKVLKTGWLTRGPKTEEFENLVKNYLRCEHVLAVNSCTAALHLSLAALDIKQGEEVITTPFTFASTVNVIIHQNARPILVDIDKETFNILPEKIEEAVTERTKAIIPVHYGGHPCEMDEIRKIASKHDLFLIEDAAHALGSEYKGRKIGTIGDSTCFSLYPTKNITSGEGGILATDFDEFAERARLLSLHGMTHDAWNRYTDKGSWYYQVLEPGYKYNMTDIQASLGLVQFQKLEKFQRVREELAKAYTDGLANIPEVITPRAKKYVKSNWHLYPILLNLEKLKIDRDMFIKALKAENIGTSVHFIPIHFHPAYRRMLDQGLKLLNAEFVYERILSLPIYPKMTEEDALSVVSAIRRIVRFYRR